MARRFTHGGRIDTRDKGPFVPSWDPHTTAILDAIAASKAARESSGFLDAVLHTDYAHDWLSRTASDIFKARTDHAEAACYDAGFDGGEFSGPEHDEMAEYEAEVAADHFFNYTGVQFSHAVRCRISEGSAHRLGF